MWAQLKALFREWEAFHIRQGLRSFRGTVANWDDFFMLITFCELYGIENPYHFYTLELLPFLMPEYHLWHQKIGIKKAFFENFPCACCC